MPIPELYNEKELLLKVAEGDEFAFRQIFDHYKKKIYTASLKITRSETTAEELLQDVFLIIWMRRKNLLQIENFESYLFIVARNEAYRAVKKAAKEKRRIGEPSATEYVFDTEERISLKDYDAFLQKAIDQLPAQQKQAYKLIKEQGLTREQAAESMQINPNTVKTHLAKAMKFIRAYFVANFEAIILAFITACVLSV